MNPASTRSLKVTLGKPEDAPLSLLFHCLEKPEKIFVSVYTSIPSLDWNNPAHIRKIKRWRGQQIKRITLQAFRFGDDADHDRITANTLSERMDFGGEQLSF